MMFTKTIMFTTTISNAAGKIVTLLTLTTLVLTGCSSQSLPSPNDESRPGPAVAAEETTGCPTPTPDDDSGLEENNGSAGQSTQDAAVANEVPAANDDDSVPSLAERETMLDRANQGPTRPGVETVEPSPAPDPSLGLQAGSAIPGALVPLSNTLDLPSDDATPTPCP